VKILMINFYISAVLSAKFCTFPSLYENPMLMGWLRAATYCIRKLGGVCMWTRSLAKQADSLNKEKRGISVPAIFVEHIRILILDQIRRGLKKAPNVIEEPPGPLRNSQLP
jgi:hypothetical protein